jgi:fumarylacetoacetase
MDKDLTAEWSRTSWIEAANDPACGFPVQSLPYCGFSPDLSPARLGVGIGDQILDLRHASRSGLLEGLTVLIQAACQQQTLNALMACAPDAQTALRARLMDLLAAEADYPTRDALSGALTPMQSAALLKPVDSANYTDFYASIHHATRVGKLFRPENPLPPNYMYVPIGYHGRASSIVVSGTPIRRPSGQSKPGQSKPSQPGAEPAFGPTRFLDYEVEVGLYIGNGNPLGEPIPIREAGQHIFGISLVNDWSARDIQSWENQPLGPFLGKSFATSVSPWVVPIAALAPFRVPARLRPNDPSPLDYLFDAMDQYTGAIALTVEAWLLTPSMRAVGQPPHRLSQANLRELWWTPAQLVAHHTSNGCNLLPATGTVSGRDIATAGCLLELTAGGKQPVALPSGECRTQLEDGDEVILRGLCRRDGFPQVTLGECRGLVAPAL